MGTGAGRRGGCRADRPRRIGTAEEAAAVALFLLSDDASYLTGSQFAVDGGLLMR